MAKYVLGEQTARELKKLLRGSGGITRRQANGAALATAPEYAHPFAVKWAASVGESGSWIIWIPANEVVVAKGKSYRVTTELKAAGGDYPEGWYKVPTDALNAKTGGDLYLLLTDDGSATLTSSKSLGLENALAVLLCKATVSEEDGTRSVKQLVRSSVILASLGEDKDTKYNADERSVSLISITDGEMIAHGNVFQIYGFGKYTNRSSASPWGFYAPPSSIELDPFEGGGTEDAFLVREGNSSEPDKNFLAYKRLKLASYLEPFKYTITTEYDEDGQPKPNPVRQIKNNVFYFDGEEITLPDYTPNVLEGTVYLVSTRAKNASTWTHKIDVNPGEKPEGGDVRNHKLYDFRAGKVECDYRAALVTISTKGGEELGEPEAALVDPPLEEGAAPTVQVETVEATEDTPKHLKFTFGIPPGKGGTGEDGKSIVRAELVQGTASGKYLPFNLKLYRNGETNPVSDFELIAVRGDDGMLFIGGVETGVIMMGQEGPMPEGFGEKSLSLSDGVNTVEAAKMIATQNVKITQKRIVAGSGIHVTEANGQVRISATSLADGYSGTLTLGGPITYHGHQITQPVYTVTLEDGLVTDVKTSSNTPITAVEETV